MKLSIERGPFEPTWESLRTYQCPDWFRDAKLGIWSHWGPQSVPMVGDWYARNIYIEGHEHYRHHWRVYGHPSKVGYKDIVKLWKAEKFDPEGLMELYVAAGAKYFVAQAVHHDNFDNWDSTHNKWNAVNMGPKKNIVGLWQAAARKHGLPFGLSEHLGATFSWFSVNKGMDKQGPYAGVPYDGSDPDYEDFYLPNQQEYQLKMGPWYTENPWWHKHWFLRIKDLIDQHQPDLLYSDGGLPFDIYGLHIVAHLYNSSAKRHRRQNQAVYTHKDRNPSVAAIGVLDIERGVEPDIIPYPWQTDTCVGSWFYNVRATYKTPKQVIEMLVDIVSKNGNLLLNIPQRPDGTLDDECRYILDRMARWIKVNGEGIYGTRSWKVSGEGPTTIEGGAFKEREMAWTTQDFRFTTKGNKVYVFLMSWPEDRKVLVRSLALDQTKRIVAVKLLGRDEMLSFEQGNTGYLSSCLRKTTEYAHVSP